jgi:probable F420-dependent oxidoreductase
MQVGAIFPQTEIGADPGAVREFVQATEDLGYDHLFIADHVLGADPQFHPEVARTPYTHRSVVHEPFTLLAYISAFTERLKFSTGILILPQRQTALVAKQAAEVDVLSGGRLRLGIGIGWNAMEYEALGQDFHTRGRRSEEQIAVMRALWTQEVVNFEGRWHKITHAGINPLPVQQPIPVWIGIGRGVNNDPPEQVLRRVARISDGWFPMISPDEAGQQVIARVHDYAREAGRDPSSIGMEFRVRIAGRPTEDWVTEAKAWEDLGATHLTVETRRGGLSSTDEHIEAIRQFKEALK